MYTVTNKGTRDFLLSFPLKITSKRTLCKDQSAIKPVYIRSQQKEKKESIDNSSLKRNLDKFKKISKIAVLKMRSMFI